MRARSGATVRLDSNFRCTRVDTSEATDPTVRCVNRDASYHATYVGIRATRPRTTRSVRAPRPTPGTRSRRRASAAAKSRTSSRNTATNCWTRASTARPSSRPPTNASASTRAKRRPRRSTASGRQVLPRQLRQARVADHAAVRSRHGQVPQSPGAAHRSLRGERLGEDRAGLLLLRRYAGGSSSNDLWDLVADDTGQGTRLYQNYLGMRDHATAPPQTRFAATTYYFSVKLKGGGNAEAKKRPFDALRLPGTTTRVSGSRSRRAARRRPSAGSTRSGPCCVRTSRSCWWTVRSCWTTRARRSGT